LKIPEVQEYDKTQTFSVLGSEGNVFPQFDAHILVAEDNLTNQIVAEGMLEHFGCQVDLVSDGHEAVESVGKHSYDLIFMDCQMPKLDGYEATREIRKHERQSGAESTPIVAFTAYAMKSDRERCLDAGMNDYLSKPFDEQQLFGVLHRWLPDKVVGSHKGNCAASLKVEKGSVHLNSEMLAIFDKIKRPGEADFLSHIIGIYLEDSPGLLEDISEALKVNDHEALQVTAHKMKSSNSQIGAKCMEEICIELEKMGLEKNVNKEKSRRLLSELEQEFVCVAEELREMRKKR